MKVALNVASAYNFIMSYRILLVAALVPTVASAQFARSGVSDSKIISVVTDAGTLLRSDRDAYANEFVAQCQSADGGTCSHAFSCQQEPCSWRWAGSTQATMTCANNACSWNVGSVEFPTMFVTAMANRGTSDMYVAPSTGAFFRFFPTTDTTGCDAASEGGVRAISSDNTLRYCNGTTLQTLAARTAPWSASLDFAVFGGVACQTLSFTATGVVRDERLATGGCGSVFDGDADLVCSLAATDTDELSVRVCCLDSAGCTDLGAITFSATAVR